MVGQTAILRWPQTGRAAGDEIYGRVAQDSRWVPMFRCGPSHVSQNRCAVSCHETAHKTGETWGTLIQPEETRPGQNLVKTFKQCWCEDAGEVRGVSEEVTSDRGPGLISPCRLSHTFTRNRMDTTNDYVLEQGTYGGRRCTRVKTFRGAPSGSHPSCTGGD